MTRRTEEAAAQASLQRIRSAFQEMPGMRLTSAQVARLCGVEPDSCESLLEALVECGYLHCGEDGSYALPVELHAARFSSRPPHDLRRRIKLRF